MHQNLGLNILNEKSQTIKMDQIRALLEEITIN